MLDIPHIRSGAILFFGSIYLAMTKKEEDSNLVPASFFIGSMIFLATGLYIHKNRDRFFIQPQIPNGAPIQNNNRNNIQDLEANENPNPQNPNPQNANPQNANPQNANPEGQNPEEPIIVQLVFDNEEDPEEEDSYSKIIRTAWIERIDALLEDNEPLEKSQLKRDLRRFDLESIMNNSDSFLKVQEALQDDCSISLDKVNFDDFNSINNKFVMIAYNNVKKEPRFSFSNFFSSFSKKPEAKENINYLVFDLESLKGHLKAYKYPELPQTILLSNCKDVFLIDEEFKEIFKNASDNQNLGKLKTL